jgi:predicted glycogen debranching enzyme
VVTPRVGKPVEVQALWLNALWSASAFSKRWETAFSRGREAFRSRFWHEPGGYLFDVVDAGHRAGANDPSLRPNQVFAVGGLPVALLAGERARRVVETIEAHLWTPLGLRTLAPGWPGYRPQYAGNAHDRDASYHQGTVGNASSLRFSRTSTMPVSGTSRRSQTPIRRTRRAAAPSRRGPSARRSDS